MLQEGIVTGLNEKLSKSYKTNKVHPVDDSVSMEWMSYDTTNHLRAAWRVVMIVVVD